MAKEFDWKRLALAEVHPLRLQILEAFDSSKKPLSPKELCRKVGAPLSNVSYHVKQLREAQIVELVKTEPRRGAVEHFYRLTR
jgi:DNA-binding transcriptional ArsR family regulator